MLNTRNPTFAYMHKKIPHRRNDVRFFRLLNALKNNRAGCRDISAADCFYSALAVIYLYAGVAAELGYALARIVKFKREGK